MRKQDLSDEIRRITGETAALAAVKALEVSESAKAKAAEVSTLAIAEALKAATLAATKAADAASAAATIAAATSKDLEYIKKDISDTKADIKQINDKLDNKYVTKEDHSILRKEVEDLAKIVVARSETYSQFGTVKNIVFGMVAIILTTAIGALMFLIIKK